MEQHIRVPILTKQEKGFRASALTTGTTPNMPAHWHFDAHEQTIESAIASTIHLIQMHIRTQDRLEHFLHAIGPENTWNAPLNWNLTIKEIALKIGTAVRIRLPVVSDYIAGEPEADVLGVGGYKSTATNIYPGPHDADMSVISAVERSITTRSQLNKLLASLPPEPWEAPPGFELAVKEVDVYVDEDVTAAE